jgi:hypothetical protein
VSVKLKFFIAAFVFVVGAVMAVIPYFTQDNFELLLPGVILIAISTPFVYYWYAKIKSGHMSMNDEEILRNAEIESRISKESIDGKK